MGVWYRSAVQLEKKSHRMVVTPTMLCGVQKIDKKGVMEMQCCDGCTITQNWTRLKMIINMVQLTHRG